MEFKKITNKQREKYYTQIEKGCYKLTDILYKELWPNHDQEIIQKIKWIVSVEFSKYKELKDKDKPKLIDKLINSILEIIKIEDEEFIKWLKEDITNTYQEIDRIIKQTWIKWMELNIWMNNALEVLWRSIEWAYITFINKDIVVSSLEEANKWFDMLHQGWLENNSYNKIIWIMRIIINNVKSEYFQPYIESKDMIWELFINSMKWFSAWVPAHLLYMCLEYKIKKKDLYYEISEEEFEKIKDEYKKIYIA